MIKITLPSALASIVSSRELTLENPGDVRGLFQALASQYPDLTRELLDESGEPEMHLLTTVNDKQISELQGLDTKLQEGDEVSLFLVLSGG